MDGGAAHGLGSSGQVDDGTPLFGRDQLVAEVRDAIDRGPHRLLTLAGPGGIGKSRVARRVAHEHVAAGGSVLSIDLATADAEVELTPAVTAATSASDGNASADASALPLLLADNVPDRSSVADQLAEAMRRAPGLRILATSRRPLHVHGERVIVVGALGRTRRAGRPEWSADDEDPAVLLFAHAAQVAGCGLRPGAWRPATVRAICSLLDGLPLAIELAARRLSVMSTDELLDRLGTRPLAGVLDGTGGPGGATAAGSFRAMVESSHAALSSPEQCAVEQLAGFEDWTTLEGITDAWPELGPDAGLDLLTGLVDAHVLEVDGDDDARWYRLRRAHRELVRERVEERLAPPGAEPAAVTALRRFAGEAVHGLLVCAADGNDPTRWYSAIGRRMRDLRSAAGWLLVHDGANAPIVVLALAMHDAERGDLTRDLPLLGQALGATEDGGSVDSAERVMLRGLEIRWRVEAVTPATDTAALAADLDAVVAAAREVGDPYARIETIRRSVVSARTIGHFDQAERHAAEAIEVAGAAGFAGAVAEFELLAGMLAHCQGRFEAAAALGASAHFRGRRLGNPLIAAQAAVLLNQLPPGTTNLPAVLPSASDLLDLLGGRGGGRSSIAVMYGIANDCVANNELRLGARATAAAIRTSCAIGLPAGAGTGLLLVIVLAARSGDLTIAAALHGAVADNLHVVEHSIPPKQRAAFDRTVEVVRRGLGDRAFAGQSSRGAGWSWTQTVEQALCFADDLAAAPANTPEPAGPLSHDRCPLTPRELEVLGLLATGVANKEIATTLGMAPKTVMHHTSNIYRKLGLPGRGAAAAWAHRAGLVAS